MSSYNVGQIFGIQKPYLMALGNDDGINRNEEYCRSDKAAFTGRKKKKTRKRIRLGPSSFKEGRWTADEHANFVKSCLIHGNNWRQVQRDVQTRTSAQIRSHAQKFVIRLCRKYSLRWNRKAYLNTKNSRTKILPLSIENMEEDDRKILEMFNCFRDTIFLSDNLLSEDLISKEARKKNERKVIMREIMKKHMKKRPIFKIEKIYKNINCNSLDINDPKFIQEFDIFNKEITNIISNNEKIVFTLLNCSTIEENQKNLFTWLENNPNFEEKSYFKNLEHEPFIKKMDEILNTWKQYTHISTSNCIFTDLNK